MQINITTLTNQDKNVKVKFTQTADNTYWLSVYHLGQKIENVKQSKSEAQVRYNTLRENGYEYESFVGE